MRGAALILGLTLALAGSAPARAQDPSADDVVARARVLGVGEQAEQLRPQFLPAARLLPGKVARPGGTKLGGRPDMPPRMRWPSCRGHRLAFLMQIDLAELAAAAPGQVGAAGRLLVFGDLRENRDGIARIELVYGRLGPGRCLQVQHDTTPLGGLLRRRTPRRTHTLRSTPVRLQPALTVPWFETADRLLPGAFGERDFFRWDELAGEAAIGELKRGASADVWHQLLGWARAVQADPVYTCGKPRGRFPARRLLVQLDYDPELRFAYGDGGVLYLTIPPADLAAGRFTRVCAEMQQG